MSIPRTPWTDDDGSGTTGTVINNAEKTALYDQFDGRWSEATSVATGNQDNLAYAEADVLRCNNATTITLRGLLAPATPLKPGKRLIIVSVGAGTVVLNDQDVNSVAANRIITGSGAPVTLAAGTGYAWLEYDSVTARWRLVGSSAGAAVSLTTGVTGILPVANGGSGAATLTGLVKGNGTSAFTVVTAPAGAVVGDTDTQTLTNKRVNPRVTSTTSSSTPTPNADTDDLYDLTAQAAAAAFGNPTGTPVNGQKLMIRIKDNATARALTWGSAYVAGGAALPSTTILSKILTIGFIYNTANALNKWQCVATSQEA